MNEFLGLSAAAWTGIYTIITFGLLVGAGVAAWYAKEQWVIARQAQLEASRPYIVVTIEPSATSRRLFDLVVKNIGQRPALDVSIKLEPPPVRARETVGHELAKIKMLTSPVAMIAPQQEMRTFYDSHLERADRDDLPTSHRVALTYRDSSKRPYSETTILDIDALRGAMFVDVKTIHDIAKTLDKMEKTLKTASVLGRSGSLDVDASIEHRGHRQQRLAEQQSELQQQHARLMERLRPATPTADEETAPDVASPE